jgi:hypothetical protein
MVRVDYLENQDDVNPKIVPFKFSINFKFKYIYNKLN